MIAELAGLALLAHDTGRRVRWKLPRPFPQPIDGLGYARIQRIEFHALGVTREWHDHAERWTMAALLTKGITRKCKAGLVQGRRGFGPNHKMGLSLPTLLALRQGIAGGLKIISRNDDGLL